MLLIRASIVRPEPRTVPFRVRTCPNIIWGATGAPAAGDGSPRSKSTSARPSIETVNIRAVTLGDKILLPIGHEQPHDRAGSGGPCTRRILIRCIMKPPMVHKRGLTYGGPRDLPGPAVRGSLSILFTTQPERLHSLHSSLNPSLSHHLVISHPRTP